MYLWRVFLVKPLAALAIVVCLATIFACFKLERRHPRNRSDKFLIAFLGLLSVYQGFRILESVGLLAISINSQLDDAIELLVTTFYLIAAMLLRFSSLDRLDDESAFRLARAAPPRLSPDVTARDLPVPKGAATLDALACALPRLSDGAFKLFAYLCVIASPAGKTTVQVSDLQLRMKLDASEVDAYWTEIECSGVAAVRREGSCIEIDVADRRVPFGSAGQYSQAATGVTAL